MGALLPTGHVRQHSQYHQTDLLSGGLRQLLQAVPGRGGSLVMESFSPKVHLSGEAGLEMTLSLPSSLIMSCPHLPSLTNKIDSAASLCAASAWPEALS